MPARRPQYFRSLWRASLKEAWDTAINNRVASVGTMAIFWIIGTLYDLAQKRWEGWQLVATEAWEALKYPAIAISAWFLYHFLWATPRRMYLDALSGNERLKGEKSSEIKKLESQISGLEAQLSAQNDRKRIESTLVMLLAQARALLKMCETDPKSPTEEVNKWAQHAADTLTAINPTLAIRFVNDAGLQPMTRTRMQSEVHRHAWEYVWLRMARLDELIKEAASKSS